MRWIVLVLSWVLILWLGVGLVPRVSTSFIFQQDNKSFEWERTQLLQFHNSPLRARQKFFFGNPLSQQPFEISLAEISTSQQSRFDERRELAEHILRLSPRSVSARLTLAELNYRDGLYHETAANIAQLLELDRQNSNLFLDILAAMSAHPSSQPAVKDILSEKPAWGGRLVSKIANQPSDFDFLIALSRDYPSSQSAVIRAFVRSGDIDRAYAAFIDFLDEDERDAVAFPYNPGFDELSGAEPFNWRINRSFASLERRGGLAISFFGQGRPWIAEQVMRLSPGNYTASFNMRGIVHRDGGHFVWTIACMDKEDELLTLPIEKLTADPIDFDAAIAVPPKGCDFQSLRLSGAAGEFPRTARATVVHVTIERSDAVTPQ